MRLVLLSLAASLTAWPQSPSPQPPAQPATKASFPCRIADYRIVAPNELRVRCGVPPGRSLQYDVQIGETDGKGGAPASSFTAQFNLDPSIEGQWAVVKLPQPLQQQKTYRLSTLASYAGIAYDVETYDFNTNPDVTVIVPSVTSPASFKDSQGRLRYILTSKVAIDPTSVAGAQISEDLGPIPRPIGARFETYQQEYHSTDTDGIGLVFIWVVPPGVKSLDTHITIKGLRNIFGPVAVPPTQRFKLPGAPKDKSSSDFYVQLLSQAGPGAKPGWATDVKLSPQLANLGGGVFFSPLALANLGWNTVQGSTTTNMIQLGAGVTKLAMIPRWPALPAIQITPRVDYETDRTGSHRNILFDGDTQWFIKGCENTIKDKNAATFAKAAYDAVQKGQKPPDADTLRQATWGLQFTAFLGTEIGEQISSQVVQSSDKKTSVTVPGYDIARLRPKIGLTYEYKRLTFTLSAIPRILLTDENVTRKKNELDAKGNSFSQIYLSKASGIRPYGEASISWQFDPAGHYALTATYKVGSLPPNFDYVSTVQSGITVKF